MTPGICRTCAHSRFALGMNYPGLSARYFLSNALCVEGKAQAGRDITVLGARGYYFFPEMHGILPFAGLETDYVTFRYDPAEGTGFAAELFAGAEYFFTGSLSFSLDIGPAYIGLSDTLSAKTAAGIEIVINTSVNWYLGI